MEEVKEEILKIIENSKKEYDKRTQIAALLLRNTKFNRELIKLSNRLGKSFFCEKDAFYALLIKGEAEKVHDEYSSTFWNPYDEWAAFCERWYIVPQWSGEIDTLANYINIEPTITSRKSSGEEAALLYINIDPWTTKKDIEAIWPEIIKAQKDVFAHKGKAFQNFSRDLCWYDLNRNGLSPNKIAKLWIKHRPDDLDILVTKRIKKKEKEELGEEDATELLREIKSDSSLKELKEEFDADRKYYTEGYIPLIVETIKKSIKNMKSKINKIDRQVK